MDHPLNEVSDWLDSQSGRTFLIRKEEDGDLDQVELELHNITLGELNHDDPDDYVAEQAILLHGEGKVINGTAQSRLPQNVYEIPLEGKWVTRTSGANFQIQTGRATYTIQPQ